MLDYDFHCISCYMFAAMKYGYLKGRFTHSEAVDECYDKYMQGYPAQMKDEHEMELVEEYLASKLVDRDVWIGQISDNNQYYKYLPFERWEGKFI